MSEAPSAATLSSTRSEPSPLWKIAAQFTQQGQVTAIEPLGNGNINHTYLVTVDTRTAQEHSNRPDDSSVPSHSRFVLQQINTQVFRQPELVIQNMAVLGEHLRCCNHELSRRWETPCILPTAAGQNFWIDGAGEYWRAISFIEDSQVFETIESVEHAREVGCGLAMFHRLISALPADQLADTLEGFHITPTYLENYAQVLAEHGEKGTAAAASMAEEQATLVEYCRSFIAERTAWAHVLEKAKAAGHLQLRPIHGDPKVNNIMLGSDGRAVSLIDLDTLKPGLVHYDIGDCLRSGCNRLGEETENWQAVEFDPVLAKAILAGYLSLAKDFLTEQDYDYLYDGIRLIAFELGLRFFTDYLAGNVYFKVKHPEHNLTRALVQFKLTESIEAQSETLKAIIEELR
ncbi:MAG: aminoglycoside phosphotransferase family protein [Cyanobacteria bacterium J06623_5]